MSLFERAQIQAADSPSIDAFGRWRISNPVTIFDSQFQYDLQTLWWEQVTATGGTITHLPNESAAQLAVTTSAGSSATLQTYQYHRYQPGKSQFVAMTFVFGAATAGIVKSLGLYDADNGILLQQNGTSGLQFVRRSKASGAVVDVAFTQSQWNLDRLDGSGPSEDNPSGINIDATTSQILIIDLQWLGVGRVRVGFDIDGVIVYAHEFLNANVISTVHMTTANLPLRANISNPAGSAGTASFKFICSQIASEGGVETERGYQFSTSNAGTGIALTTSVTPMLTIRPKATFNSIVNRGLVIPDHFHVAILSGNIWYALVYRPTVTVTPSYASVNADSIVEVDVASTTIAGGVVVDTGYVMGGGGVGVESVLSTITTRFPFCLDAAGAVRGWFTLAARMLTGTGTGYASISWKEYR